MSNAFYNDTDAKACAWLGRLAETGLVTAGTIDSRSIKEIQGNDLRGYDRVHLFAGIGGWDYALRLAGWTGPVWTGSCPCQPFSSAGKRKGTADERHLWPDMCRLIRECRPPVVFGEQVASKDGLLWLDGVQADLEALGYAVGAADLCAAGIGAPHIRQRLYWVADAERRTAERHRPELGAATGGVQGEARERQRIRADAGDVCNTGRLGNADCAGLQAQRAGGEWAGSGDEAFIRSAASHWHPADLVPCRDGKSRRIEPGSFPLAHGVPGRVAQLRGLGNAIVPPLAAEFVMAYMEARG